MRQGQRVKFQGMRGNHPVVVHGKVLASPMVGWRLVQVDNGPTVEIPLLALRRERA